MLDFAALPPEINSRLMHRGPGSGPMLSAVAAWDDMAAELYSAASFYGSVISDLTSGWLGPSSAAMAAAAAPYVLWITTTAGQAEETGAQAKAAVAAYEAAFAMTVPLAGDCGESGVVDGVDRDELLRSEHAGDHGHRGAVPGDVDPGRRGNV